MFIIKEREISYKDFVDAVQLYVDDNYKASTIKIISSYLKNGHKRDFRPPAFSGIIYRGIFYHSIKDINKVKRIVTRDISATYSLEEAQAFAFGSNIYEFSSVKSELKSMDKNDAAIVYEVVASLNEIMIDVRYCLKKGLLNEVSFIEENEVMLYPTNHQLIAKEIYYGGDKF